MLNAENRLNHHGVEAVLEDVPDLEQEGEAIDDGVVEDFLKEPAKVKRDVDHVQ